MSGHNAYDREQAQKQTERGGVGVSAVDVLVSCPRGDLEDLLMYADTAAKILRETGFPGKAEALEQRYTKVAKAIGFDGN